MDNKVSLSFDKTLSNLAGYDYGVSVFNSQVNGKIDLNSQFVIEFPEQIRGVASSFVQGFFNDIVQKIGLLATEQRALIVSSRDGFSEMIMSKLQ